MRQTVLLLLAAAILATLSNCTNTSPSEQATSSLEPDTLVISRFDYADKLYGFWLGECIANWTGLVTEMDKIGNIGEIKTGAFYTRDDWGKPDQPSQASGGRVCRVISRKTSTSCYGLAIQSGVPTTTLTWNTCTSIAAFGNDLSDRFNIHRTRRGFPNNGIDTFDHMAEVGVRIVDRIVREELGGEVDAAGGVWRIPAGGS